MLKSLLTEDVEVNLSIDDIRLRSDLSTNRTKEFTKSSFFDAMLAFTRSHSYPLDDTDWFYQILPIKYTN